MKSVLSTIITIGILAWALPTVTLSNWVTLVLASLVFTILFGVVRPILKLLFLPINVITLGLFSAFLNIALLWLTTYLVPGFSIEPMIVLGVHLNQFWALAFIAFFIGFLHSIVKKFL